MNDMKIMTQQLKKYERLYEEWLMNGYDTPQLAWGEQLEQYQEMINRIKQDIKEMGNEIINTHRHSR